MVVAPTRVLLQHARSKNTDNGLDNYQLANNYLFGLNGYPIDPNNAFKHLECCPKADEQAMVF
jgi:hypothetical protein